MSHPQPTVIEPSVGRIVLVIPGQTLAGILNTPEHIIPEGNALGGQFGVTPILNPSEPVAAIVTRVHHDRFIDVTAFLPGRLPRPLTGLRLLQGDDTAGPHEAHARWMPYQVGQAQYAAQLAAAVRAADPGPTPESPTEPDPQREG